MTSHVPTELRRLVFDRADNSCEYCLIRSDDTLFGCQVDHIIAEKHGGKTISENLACACVFCNRYKGSDIGSLTASSKAYTRFFNPRTDRWDDHFRFNQFLIEPLSPIGEVTVSILQLDHIERLLEREMLHISRRFPPKPF